MVPPLDRADAVVAATALHLPIESGRNPMSASRSNRWLIAAAGVVMQIALGAVYAWSVFRIPLTTTYGWTIAQVTQAF
jgi:hypothetical protein